MPLLLHPGDLVPALEMFDELLGRHLERTGGEVQVSACDGSTFPLQLPDWCAPADEIDRAALARLAAHLPPGAAVVDMACGPGRHARHLAAHGMGVLGVDLAATAVAHARSKRVAALRRDIFQPLPAAGSWDAVLLLDGNIGIEGAPARLLNSVRLLLAPAGLLLVELDGQVSDRRTLQLHDGRRSSTPFAWARVSAADLGRLAADQGLTVLDQWSGDLRTFALLGHR